MMTLQTLSRFLTRRNFGRGLLLCAAAVLSGCGGGISNFTGGGFPIGKSAVIGRVVDARHPATVLPNVNLTLFSTPTEGTTRILRTMTDANGEYSFPDVPTGEVSAPIMVAVEPTNGEYRSQSVSFQVYNGRSASMIVALSPKSFDADQAKSITISPPTNTLPPGSTVRYTARVYDEAGQILPVTPTLVVNDALGTLSPDGLFTAATTGTSTMQAFWYNNLHASATIIVDSNAIPLPPVPPIAADLENRSLESQSHSGEVGGAIQIGGNLH